MKAKEFDLLDSIMSFESGELEFEEAVTLFQHLVDTGMAWQLQGMYGRVARNLIEEGYISR